MEGMHGPRIFWGGRTKPPDQNRRGCTTLNRKKRWILYGVFGRDNALFVFHQVGRFHFLVVTLRGKNKRKKTVTNEANGKRERSCAWNRDTQKHSKSGRKERKDKKEIKKRKERND